MGALSHEMRTPLTSIIGYSDTLRLVKLKDGQKDRALEHINREGKRLEALSGKMLQMLGLYQNHAIQMEMTMAGDLLNHVIDMEKEQAEKKAVHLKMECEAFSMKMDPALMESLLINLIDNALKATDAGGSIWVKAYEKAGKRSLRCRIPEWDPGGRTGKDHRCILYGGQITKPKRRRIWTWAGTLCEGGRNPWRMPENRKQTERGDHGKSHLLIYNLFTS